LFFNATASQKKRQGSIQLGLYKREEVYAPHRGRQSEILRPNKTKKHSHQVTGEYSELAEERVNGTERHETALGVERVK
jgi:hypothetical protein